VKRHGDTLHLVRGLSDKEVEGLLKGRSYFGLVWPVREESNQAWAVVAVVVSESMTTSGRVIVPSGNNPLLNTGV
jgi:hypothetical protein